MSCQNSKKIAQKKKANVTADSDSDEEDNCSVDKRSKSTGGTPVAEIVAKSEVAIKVSIAHFHINPGHFSKLSLSRHVLPFQLLTLSLHLLSTQILT